MERTSGLAAMISIIPGDTPSARCWFVAYAAVFLVFTLNLLPVNLAVLAMVAVFLTAPGSVLPYLYFFSFPWALVATFDFGLTLSLVQSVVYVGRMFMARQTVRFSRLEFIILAYLLGQSLFGFLNNGSTTPLSYVFYFLIVCHVRTSYFQNDTNRYVFLRNMLFSIMVSMSIATIYGFVNATSLDRYIPGLGYANQMNGTLGTQRFAMYLLIAMLYPLYYVDNKTWKLLLCVLGVAGIIATVSTAAFVLLCLFLTFYFVTSGGKLKTILLFATFGLVVLLAGALLWNSISRNPFFRPMAMRMELTSEELQTGDMNKASTGRVTLFNSYLEEFIDLDWFEQLFGRQVVKTETLYSHNSYLDMLNSIGILGAILVFLLQISRIVDYFKCPERNLLLLLKLATLLTAGSVSIFSAQFWQVFLYF